MNDTMTLQEYMEADLIGRRIRIKNYNGFLEYYGEGNTGTIVGDVRNITNIDSDYIFDGVFVQFDEPHVNDGTNPSWLAKYGPTPGLWYVSLYLLEIIEEECTHYSETGKSKWTPDTLNPGIDVMQVTAELCSIEVGK